MNSASETKILELLDLEADGCLPEADRPLLEKALAESPEYERELDRLRDVRLALEASRVEVRPGFTAEVMELLPVAAWEQTTKSYAADPTQRLTNASTRSRSSGWMSAR